MAKKTESVKVRNRNTLILAIGVIALLVYVIVCLLYTKYIPLPFIGVIIVVFEFTVIVPSFIKNYYKMWEAESNTVTRYIPLYNYTLTTNKVIAWLIYISYVLVFLVTLSIIFPELINLISSNLVLKSESVLPNILVGTILLSNILIGLGYYLNSLEIASLFSKAFPSMKSGKIIKIVDTVHRYFPVLFIILLMLPVTRCIILSFSLDRLHSLNNLGITQHNIEEYRLDRRDR